MTSISDRQFFVVTPSTRAEEDDEFGLLTLLHCFRDAQRFGVVMLHLIRLPAVLSVSFGAGAVVADLTRTHFVIARSEATWRSRSRSSVPCPNEIVALRSQ